jgi:hypothetical protein
VEAAVTGGGEGYVAAALMGAVVIEVGAGQPGHSVNTEPIGSVLQYLCKFGS